MKCRPRELLTIVLVTSSFLCGARVAAAETGSHSYKGVDLQGKLHVLAQHAETKAVVVCFLATRCRISDRYVAALKHLSTAYRRRGIEIYGVFNDPTLTRRDAVAQCNAQRIHFPVLFDVSDELLRGLRPTHQPQVFLLNRAGEKLYSGAIDDGLPVYEAEIPNRAGVARNYLEDAIRSVLKDQKIRTRKTEPDGRVHEGSSLASNLSDVNYARHIAPIIQANCTSCHRPGQSAPFPLLTYNDVSKRARQIVEVTQSGFMPPWKPEPGFGHFLDDRRLTRRSLSLLKAWDKNGKRKGDPADLPPKPQFADGWRLGQPDEVLHMKRSFTVPAEGPDIRQYFVIPTNLKKNRLVSAIDFHPGVPQAIHHASFFVDANRAARKLDESDPGPGYRGFGGPRIKTQGTLRSWFPGMSPRRLPKGSGRLVPRGADIVAEIHYICSGKPENDRSQVGLYYAGESARRLVEEIQVANKEIEIPAGAKRHRETASFTLPVTTTLLDVAPHMHVLGREIKATATLPDGRVEPLIWIQDWDFNWQSQYSYAEPIRLPGGTQITVEAWYDNSTDNMLNPNSPPKTVYWGEDSADEMLICHFQFTCDSLSNMKTVMTEYKKYFDNAQEFHSHTALQRDGKRPTDHVKRPFR